ncbi:MAG: hypothetical protein FJ221_16050 [Lentisphaerae bacterium]|nr:hypothetical protein [Lentisphaerota bacterium]
MNPDSRRRLLQIVPDIAAFAGWLTLAWYFKWETRDLVWSLWLSSLVVGYLTLLSALGAGLVIGVHALRQKEFPVKRRWAVALGGLAVGLFMLAFFSVHFCGFHAGHSVFLQGFFPIEGLPSDGFGRAFANPPLLWVLVFRHLVGPYGAFVVPALLAERRQVFGALEVAVRAVLGRDAAAAPSASGVRPLGKDGDRHPIGDFMGRPYLNVVRMHVLIFVFAGCHALKVNTFVVYAIVSVVYFFPWRALAGSLRGRVP